MSEAGHSDSTKRLEELMDSMSMDHRQDFEKVDQLADVLREKLEVNLGDKGFRELAMQLAQINLENRRQNRHQQQDSNDRVNTSFEGGTNENVGGNLKAAPHRRTSSAPSPTGEMKEEPSSSSSSSSGFRSSCFVPFQQSGVGVRSPLRSPGRQSTSYSGSDPSLSPSVSRGRSRRTTPSKTPTKSRINNIFSSSSSSSKSHHHQQQQPPPSQGGATDSAQKRRQRGQRSPSPFNNVFHRKKPAQEEKKDPEEMSLLRSQSFDPTLHSMSTEANTDVFRDRPPSRPSTPSNRPGLQDDDDADRVSERSPARPVNYQPSSRRSRSLTPNAHKRVADMDEDSVRQPAPPRAFSQSPLPRSDTEVEPTHHQTFTPSATSHTMPDLSIPNLDSRFKSEPSLDGDSFFTPPPQHNHNSYNDEDDEPDMHDPLGHEPEIEIATGHGKQRRKGPTPDGMVTGSGISSEMPIFTEHAFPSAEGGFTIGKADQSLSRRKIVEPKRHPRRRPTKAASAIGSVAPVQTDILGNAPASFTPFESRKFSVDVGATGADTTPDLFSPMEVDTPRETPEPFSFNMGVGGPSSRRRVRLGKGPGSALRHTQPPDHSHVVQTPLVERDQFHPQPDFSGRSAVIASKRDEAKALYMASDYAGSIHTYTNAIEILGPIEEGCVSDVFALLLSNRAAGFLMVGAYEAAVEDCALALRHVSQPSLENPLSNESGILLKIKLLTRMGRAYMKQGHTPNAMQSFDDALEQVQAAKRTIMYIQDIAPREDNLATLETMETEATLGRTETKRLDEFSTKINDMIGENARNLDERKTYAEALGHVNMALSIANGSPQLYARKIFMLSYLRRWREVAGFCERLAAINVRWDTVFAGVLASRHPFVAVPPANKLSKDFFNGERDESPLTAQLKLTSMAAAEAVLRIPYNLTCAYLRALRLEERYPAAEAALSSLAELRNRGQVLNIQELVYALGWLDEEVEKLKLTKKGREDGDDLFRRGQYDLAAKQYAACLTIDSSDPSAVGGRLHAVLHCNRAACLMAQRFFEEAIEECTSALRIHSRYMKAMLRRARCYVRLQRLQEAITEYTKWLSLVDEAKSPNAVTTFVTPCLFDGPSDATEADVELVRKELDDAHRVKRRAEAAAQEEANRRRDRARWQDAFPNAGTWQSSNAQQRREEWYNQQNGNRRWDSFSGRGPRTNQSRSQSWNNERTTPGAGLRTASMLTNRETHYTVLQVPHDASEEAIKKAYRALAKQYHPDKNKDEGAPDMFRRVQAAYEVLMNTEERRKYDLEITGRRRF